MGDKKETSRVDIVIATYNASDWIKQTIESALGQSLKPNKIIVVDDNSSDNTQEIVSRFSDVLLLPNPQNIGVGPTRNRGFKHTDSEFVAFLDHDDLWHCEHLDLLVKALKENPDTVVAGSSRASFQDGDAPQFDLSDRSQRIVDPWEVYPCLNIDPAPSAFLFRRKDLSEIGGWMEDFRGITDYCMLLRTTVKKPYIKLGVKTFGYRKHKKSELHKLSRNTLPYIELWKKAADNSLNFALSCDLGPERVSRLKKRNLLVPALYDFLKGHLNSDPALSKKGAEEMEAVLIDEPEEFLSTIKKDINFITFYNTGRSREEVIKYYSQLIRFCSDKTPVFRQLLMKAIAEKKPGIKVYIEYFLGRPFEIYRLKRLLNFIKYRVLRIYKDFRLQMGNG